VEIKLTLESIFQVQHHGNPIRSHANNIVSAWVQQRRCRLAVETDAAHSTYSAEEHGNTHTSETVSTDGGQRFMQRQ
jgi:hypothetical protein